VCLFDYAYAICSSNLLPICDVLSSKVYDVCCTADLPLSSTRLISFFSFDLELILPLRAKSMHALVLPKPEAKPEEDLASPD
jgi:hypothetical protein